MVVLVLPWSKITAGGEPGTGSFFAFTIFTFTMIISLFESPASSASAGTGFSIFAKGVPSFAAGPPRLTGNGRESLAKRPHGKAAQIMRNKRRRFIRNRLMAEFCAERKTRDLTKGLGRSCLEK